MGFLPGKSGPTMIRIHYEKLLYPYDVFQAGAFTGEPVQVSKVIILYLSLCQHEILFCTL